jgi:hypothetical protein
MGVYRFDEETHAVLDLDDARVLLERGLRPTDVVIRNRPRTQSIARMVYSEGQGAGMSWWSMHRPQWTLYIIWTPGVLRVERVEPLVGHPAVAEASRLLAKHLGSDLA